MPLAGQSFTLNTSINGTLLANTPRTGTLTLSEGGTTLASVNIATTAPNSYGQYALTVPAGFSVGTQALTVAYSGDSNYAAATSWLSLVIANDSLSLQYSSQAYLGQTYTVNAAINGGWSTASRAPARCPWSKARPRWPAWTSRRFRQIPAASSLEVPGGLPAGANSLKVVYSGDAAYTSLTSSLATVTSANDFLGLSYTGSVLVGQPYTVGVSILTGTTPVNPALTGTLTLIPARQPGQSNITGVGGEQWLLHPLGADWRDSLARQFERRLQRRLELSSTTASLTITGVTRCRQPRPVLQHDGNIRPGIHTSVSINGTLVSGVAPPAR